jgi:mediator of RNA polymerase II transcription subunit 12
LNVINERFFFGRSFRQPNFSNENTTNLSDFAQHVLRQICSQVKTFKFSSVFYDKITFYCTYKEWVLERCLQNAEELCELGLLIDVMLSDKQAQRLLHMICYPDNDTNMKSEMEPKAIISRILENLEQWSLRISWLDLQLMYKQTASNSVELSNWLDMVARAAIDVFQINEMQTKLVESWMILKMIF